MRNKSEGLLLDSSVDEKETRNEDDSFVAHVAFDKSICYELVFIIAFK